MWLASKSRSYVGLVTVDVDLPIVCRQNKTKHVLSLSRYCNTFKVTDLYVVMWTDKYFNIRYRYSNNIRILIGTFEFWLFTGYCHTKEILKKNNKLIIMERNSCLNPHMKLELIVSYQASTPLKTASRDMFGRFSGEGTDCGEHASTLARLSRRSGQTRRHLSIYIQSSQLSTWGPTEIR